MNSRVRNTVVFTAITLAAIGGLFLAPRFDIPPTYHNFADRRSFAGIPNAADVISNVAFLLAGIYGTTVTYWTREHFEDCWEVAAYLVFFVGLALTVFGSGYYHLAPNDARLFWDRLPMTVCFMALFSAMIGERVSVRAGNYLLIPLIFSGAASLIYWYWTVQHGVRDLRPYALVQAYPLLAIVLLLLMFPPRYSRTADFVVALGFYVAAKVFELTDKPVFAATGGVVSGHTLKHIAAAVGGYWIARMLMLRTKVVPSSASIARGAGQAHV